jgi:hypothetical protein
MKPVIGLSCIVFLITACIFAAEEKFKLPSTKDLEKATATVRDIFQADFNKTLPTDKAALATKLLATAKDTLDDAAGVYALLKEAILLAPETNNDLVVKACEELIKRFDDSSDKLLGPVVGTLLKSNPRPETCQALANFLIVQIEQAILLNQAESSEKLYTLAEQVGTQAKSERVSKDIYAQGRIVEQLKKSLKNYQEATGKLKSNPQDAEACLIAGQHACFFNADWPKGLTLLAKSSDQKLKHAAARDLESRDIDHKSLLAAADAWSQAFPLRDAYPAHHLYQRIKSLYSKALPHAAGHQTPDREAIGRD